MRTSEVDRRLSKASASISEIENSLANPQILEDGKNTLSELLQKLQSELDRASALRYFCKTVRGFSSEDLIAEVSLQSLLPFPL